MSLEFSFDYPKENVKLSEKEINSFNHLLKSSLELASREVKFLDDQVQATIIFIDDEKMTSLNWGFRNINKTTDVLSYPNHSKEDTHYLGDVFISVDQVKKQFSDYNQTIFQEYSFLICHGILHLLGYDHQVQAEAEVMSKLEKNILEIFFEECKW